MKGRCEEELGKQKWLAVFSILPVFSEVLRLSKSAKPLCEDTATRLPTSTGGLRLLSRRRENSRRVFYASEDSNFQECN